MSRTLKSFVIACSSLGLIANVALDAQACGGRGGGIGGGFGGYRAPYQPSYQQPYCNQGYQQPQFPQSGYNQLNQYSQYQNPYAGQYPGSQYPGQLPSNPLPPQSQLQQQSQLQPERFQSAALQGSQFSGGQFAGSQFSGSQFSGSQVQSQSSQVQVRQLHGQTQGQVVQGQQIGGQVQGQVGQGQQVQAQQQTAFRPRTPQTAVRVSGPSASSSALGALGGGVQQTQVQQPVQQQQIQQQPVQQPIANAAPQQSAPVQSQPSQAETPVSLDAENAALQALLGSGVTQQAQPAEQEAASTPATSGQFRASVSNGATIQLSLNADGTFQWVAVKDGKSSEFQGSYTLNGGSLVLQRSDNQKLEGSVTFNAGGFNLKFAGQKDDGLAFVRG